MQKVRDPVSLRSALSLQRARASLKAGGAGGFEGGEGGNLGEGNDGKIGKMYNANLKEGEIGKLYNAE